MSEELTAPFLILFAVSSSRRSWISPSTLPSEDGSSFKLLNTSICYVSSFRHSSCLCCTPVLLRWELCIDNLFLFVIPSPSRQPCLPLLPWEVQTRDYLVPELSLGLRLRNPCYFLVQVHRLKLICCKNGEHLVGSTFWELWKQLSLSLWMIIKLFRSTVNSFLYCILPLLCLWDQLLHLSLGWINKVCSTYKLYCKEQLIMNNHSSSCFHHFIFIYLIVYPSNKKPRTSHTYFGQKKIYLILFLDYSFFISWSMLI